MYLESLKSYQNVLLIGMSMHFKIMHNRLNTTQLLFKMKFVETDKSLCCENILDSTFHVLYLYLYHCHSSISI